MKLFEKNTSAKYRAEGLNLAQASRLNQGSDDFKRNALIAGLAFMAVGSLAYIGLQTITGEKQVARVFSAAPPQGSAVQMMMALKVPHDRANEAARLAILNDESGPMEIKSLDRVEQMINPERMPTTVAQVAIPVIEPVVKEIVEALPTPVLPVIEPEAGAEPPAIEVAINEVETTAPSCYQALQEVAKGATIFFGIGSSQLSTNALSDLQKIGHLTADCPTAVVHVTGHSDTSGNDLINLNLSWQRADNVVAAMSQMGIDTSRFEPVGFGARSPLAQGDTSDEDLNRRVEFVVIRATY